MLKALLLDLDDTLLGNPMTTFIPAYFRALTSYVADRVHPEALIDALVRGMAAMEGNNGAGPTNEEAFAAVFFPALGQDRSTLEPVFQRFYAEAFPSLRVLTTPRPEARLLVDWALGRKVDVVIATNAVFPAVAIEERLRWAGLDPTEVDLALVTSYELMHATKSSPAFYTEILDRIAVPADACLMVGDDAKLDIARAGVAGVPTYWISGTGLTPDFEGLDPVGQGTLNDFWRWLPEALDTGSFGNRGHQGR